MSVVHPQEKPEERLGNDMPRVRHRRLEKSGDAGKAYGRRQVAQIVTRKGKLGTRFLTMGIARWRRNPDEETKTPVRWLDKVRILERETEGEGDVQKAQKYYVKRAFKTRPKARGPSHCRQRKDHVSERWTTSR